LLRGSAKKKGEGLPAAEDGISRRGGSYGADKRGRETRKYHKTSYNPCKQKVKEPVDSRKFSVSKKTGGRRVFGPKNRGERSKTNFMMLKLAAAVKKKGKKEQGNMSRG